MFVLLLIAIFCLVLGLFLRRGKGLMLLAGYNTMSSQERETVDKEALARRAGNLLSVMALGFGLLALSIKISIPWLSVGILLALIAGSMVFSLRLSQPGTNKRTKVTSVVICSLALAGVAILFWYGEKTPVVTLWKEGLHIGGMYGLGVDYAEIANVALIDQSAGEMGLVRVNGYGGLGQSWKGHFQSQELGRVLLFVRIDTQSMIHIGRTAGQDIYISLPTSEETQDLFDEIKTHWVFYNQALA